MFATVLEHGESNNGDRGGKNDFSARGGQAVFRPLPGLRRLELEHMAHGGQDNGKLPCRYHDFIDYGCRRHGLSAALIEVEALGFAKTMSLGTRAYGNVPGKASTFRLTYLHTQDGPPTQEWKKLSSIEEARAAVTTAQRTYSDWLDASKGSARDRQRRRRKNKTPAPETGPNPAPEVGAKLA